MDEHIHVWEKSRYYCHRENLDAHILEVAVLCPSDSYMREDNTAESEGGLVGETRKERA